MKKMFYEIYPMEYYTKENIEKLTVWEMTFLIKLLNDKLDFMTRPSTIKSNKLITYYQNQLQQIKSIFNNLYNDLFDRTANYTDDDIVIINMEFNRKYKIINDLINNSLKEVML